MTSRKKEPYPVFNELECKACERCIIACREGVLKMSEDINERGYHYAVYTGKGCTGCGDCYYTCPEPLAVEVHVPRRKAHVPPKTKEKDKKSHKINSKVNEDIKCNEVDKEVNQ